jgi:sodium/hydrogen exchanger 8
MGLICSLIFKHSNLKALPAYETLILFIMAYVSFAVGEACKLSGVMALFFCGIILSHYNFYNLSDAARVSTKTLFHSIALASETFVFIYMGMCLFTGEFVVWDVAFCVIAVLACLLGRAVNTFGISLLINGCSQCKKKKNKLSFKMQFIIWFAGLRGAIAFALAFTMPEEEGWNREAIVTTTLVVVFFTTIVIGGLTEPVIRKVRVQATDEEEDDILKANTGYSHMDLEFPATPHKSRSLTKGGMHGAWKRVDEGYMKRWFGGPKSGSLIEKDNMGQLTPKARTEGSDSEIRLETIDLNDSIGDHNDTQQYVPPASPDTGKDDNEDDGGATARVSDDDDMFDGNDEMLELDDSDL